MQLAGLLIFVIIVLSIIAPSIGLNIIFLILGAVIAIAVLLRNKAIQSNINKVPKEALHIVNVEKGGVIELRGVGDSCKNMTLNVLAKHLYQEGDFSWFELECDKGVDDKVWVEVEDDDETIVSVVLKKMKLSDINTTINKLTEIDYNEAGSISYNNKQFNYEDSGDAVFYRFCDDTKAEKLYYWDFVNGNEILSVEKWGERDYEAFLSQKMRPSQVTVLRNKG